MLYYAYNEYQFNTVNKGDEMARINLGARSQRNADGLRADEVTPRRLLLAAALAIHLPDNADRDALYRQHKYHGTTVYLDQFATGAEKPCNNDAQREINEIAPDAKKLHLYIAAFNVTVPTHYASLVKENGLWHLASRRIQTLPADKPLPRDGILVSWRTRNPADTDTDPDRAIRLPIYFTRVLVGGAAINGLVRAGENDYETRRQLSHLALLSSLYATSNKRGILVVRERRASVTFTVTGQNNGDPISGWVRPYTFKATNSHLAARPVGEKRKITFRSDGRFPKSAPENCPAPRPRTLLPVLNGPLPLTPYPWTGPHATLLLEDERDIIGTCLYGGLLPLVGIKRGHEDVVFYGMHQEGDIAHLVEHETRARIESCGSLPVFSVFPRPEQSPVWSPNRCAAEIMAGYLYGDDSDNEDAKDRRWGHLADLMRKCGKTPKRYVLALEEMGVHLGATYRETIIQRLREHQQI